MIQAALVMILVGAAGWFLVRRLTRAIRTPDHQGCEKCAPKTDQA